MARMPIKLAFICGCCLGSAITSITGECPSMETIIDTAEIICDEFYWQQFKQASRKATELNEWVKSEIERKAKEKSENGK